MNYTRLFFSFILNLSFAYAHNLPKRDKLSDTQVVWSFENEEKFVALFKKNELTENLIREFDLDVLGVNLRNQSVEVWISESLAYKLRDRGVNFVHYYPSFLFRGADPKYFSPEKLEKKLNNFVATYPNLTHLQVIGKTQEGRPIWALKISDNPQREELDEPSIVFNSMHHAREVMTPEVTVDTIETLLNGYETNIEIKNWIENNEIWVIPMVNPDGNARIWAGEVMWRKNTTGGHGVDLNRNYPTNWNKCNGSSGFRFSDTYRGPRAASENEVQAIMNFITKVRPAISLSYHSFSEMVLYPYGCRPQKAQLDRVAQIANELGRMLNYKVGTPWELLYNADGGDIDWLWEEQQILAFVFEVNSSEQGGFHPEYDRWRDETVKKMRPAWMHLLRQLNGSGIFGILNKDLFQPQKGLVFIDVKNKKGERVTQYRVQESGRFHVILSPGEYTLELKAPQRSIQSQKIKIDQALERVVFE